MDLKLEKLPDEPIIIMTLRGEITSVDLQLESQLDRAMERALQESEEPDYLIVDAREIGTSFKDLMALLKLLPRQDENPYEQFGVQEFAHPPVFVGSNQIVDTYIRKVLPGAFQTTDAPVFKNLEDALAYVRRHQTMQHS